MLPKVAGLVVERTRVGKSRSGGGQGPESGSGWWPLVLLQRSARGAEAPMAPSLRHKSAARDLPIERASIPSSSAHAMAKDACDSRTAREPAAQGAAPSRFPFHPRRDAPASPQTSRRHPSPRQASRVRRRDPARGRDGHLEGEGLRRVPGAQGHRDARALPAADPLAMSLAWIARSTASRARRSRNGARSSARSSRSRRWSSTSTC